MASKSWIEPVSSVPLTVEVGGNGQFTICNKGRVPGEFDANYVSLGGYCGPYSPHLFAAAPDVLDALAKLEAAASAALDTIDKYNADSGTHLVGGGLLKLAKAIAPARELLARATSFNEGQSQ